MTPGDPRQLIEMAQQVQAQVAAAQAELERARVTGTAGGGLVTATVSGVGELTDLVITPAAVDPDDLEGLADLVVAAVRAATTQARTLSETTMGEATGGMSALGANLGLGM